MTGPLMATFHRTVHSHCCTGNMFIYLYCYRCQTSWEWSAGGQVYCCGRYRRELDAEPWLYSPRAAPSMRCLCPRTGQTVRLVLKGLKHCCLVMDVTLRLLKASACGVGAISRPPIVTRGNNGSTATRTTGLAPRVVWCSLFQPGETFWSTVFVQIARQIWPR